MNTNPILFVKDRKLHIAFVNLVSSVKIEITNLRKETLLSEMREETSYSIIDLQDIKGNIHVNLDFDQFHYNKNLYLI